jgi:hypothetical protein
MQLKTPAEIYDREVDQNQPKAARKQETAELFGAPRTAVEKSRQPREKDEDGGAKMRDPAGEKQRWLRHIARIETTGSEKVPRMV